MLGGQASLATSPNLRKKLVSSALPAVGLLKEVKSRDSHRRQQATLFFSKDSMETELST